MKRVLLLAALLACGGKPTPTKTPTDNTITTTTTGDQTTTPPAKVDPDDVPLELWPAVKKGKLDNGLTYYIMKHGKPEKRAYLWLAVNAGSVQEDEDQRGLAHFVEHMAFNGTKRFPKNAIIKYIESIGMRFGADLNASTWWDETIYKLEVPSDDKAILGKGLDILRDWAGDISFEDDEIKKESGVVLEEWRLGRGAGMRLFDKHNKVTFAGTRYADRITIGDPDIIKAAKPEALKRYYHDWYRPDLMAVIVVGDIDPEALEKEITSRFGNLANPEKPRARQRGGVPAANGTRVSIEADKEMPAMSISVSNIAAHRPESSRNDYRRLVGEQLYGAILNERLASIARKPDAPFVFAAGGFDAASGGIRDADAFSRFAQVKGGKVEDTLRALMIEVLRIERNGVSDSELERARTNLKRAIEESAETYTTRDGLSFVQEITRNFFEGELMIGAERERDLTLEYLPKITVDELNGLARKFSGAESRVVLISGPDIKLLPTKDRVLAILDEVSKSTIEAWEDKTSTAKLMEKPPTPGKVTKESTIPELGVTEWTLSNGVRVVVKPTDFEIDAVTISGSSPGGEANVKDAAYNDARFADELVATGGVADFDVETLGKLLAGKRVSVDTGIGDSTESIDASGSVKDLETMLQLLHLRMTAPHKDEQAFGVWKANMIERLTQMAARSPDFKYSRESTAALYKGNPRRKFPEPDDIMKVNLDKSLAFYKDRFGDATDFTFVIVGAVNLETLKPLVETYLASLPAKGRKEKEKDVGVRKVAGIVKKEWKLGSEPKAQVLIDMHGDEKWTRDKDRDMFILSQVVATKLREVLREDKGGVYGVRANGRISRAPHEERTFSISFGCDPTRVDELVKAAFEVMDDIAKNGVADSYLENIKATFLRQRETEMRRNAFWANWLENAYRYGDDPKIILDPSMMVARMKVDFVKASAKKYLDRKAYYQAVMLPADATPAPTQTPAK